MPRLAPRIAPALIALATLCGACALGDEEPGCRDDAECPDGFLCRAGACFRIAAGEGPADAGSDADAAP